MKFYIIILLYMHCSTVPTQQKSNAITLSIVERTSLKDSPLT